MDGKSLDIKENNISALRELFPGIFSEGKVDRDKFKATFGDDIYFHNERYTRNWAGKADAFKTLQEHTTATLKPQPDLSVNFDTTGNVFIAGENLEVLKVLLPVYRVFESEDKTKALKKFVSEEAKSGIYNYQMKKEEQDKITGEVIGCAMEVHNILGNRFREVVYQRALSIEKQLRKRLFNKKYKNNLGNQDNLNIIPI